MYGHHFTVQQHKLLFFLMQKPQVGFTGVFPILPTSMTPHLEAYFVGNSDLCSAGFGLDFLGLWLWITHNNGGMFESMPKMLLQY